MTPSLVEDYALRRAAELTLQQNYDWFRVVGRDITGEERGGVSLGAGLGSGSYGAVGRCFCRCCGDLGRVGAQEFITIRMEILMGSGESPADLEIYDARSVLDFAPAGDIEAIEG